MIRNQVFLIKYFHGFDFRALALSIGVQRFRFKESQRFSFEEFQRFSFEESQQKYPNEYN
ncbi:MAG: hypothetical protein KAI83_07585 [Thiomargarita sp.]|nr:hypothetical protein [Thiomargarita sp.]